ncbi:hypothetical protein HYH03_014094 [Edaphochlamys debaryana]|uniref:phosphoglucomutase (alpha-D-glucose-1,6-bisphosphate-dependent) n=1 Tax=Edaphochlamys debaryana TaxID=47281 RepID=A0A835XPN0_9CHLO|nr:hypothetical protein HYH03_014094 [Edaphochlamys debaryana]|eukprot:KAG2487252.1 hypothetical protein HYH03_014094 [Edaphochlamys debaryana]
MSPTEGPTILHIPTQPYDDQKFGTSGLRKPTATFMREHYLDNCVQALFYALGEEEVRGKSLGLGGDGRCTQAAQTIIRLAAGNGFARVVVGRDALLATPAASALIRRRGLYGGIIMTASHNPGGPEHDFGIKFNRSAGEPAPDHLTDRVFEETRRVAVLKLGVTRFGSFEVEVVDPAADYLAVLQEVFDFNLLRGFLGRRDFSLVFDAMHAVTGPYARRILVEELGAPPECVVNGTPSPDFGGGHPDPNLTHAHDLVGRMWSDSAPDFGAASDGDGDRNMVLGRRFFVNPCDSVAVIAAHAQACIPHFRQGLKGVARSMPTSGALDRVAAALGLRCHETPTGWKYFGSLMDAGLCSLCGEESFGTGADHIREKDGLFAVLAWLSVLAHANRDVPEGGPLVGVEDIVRQHWLTYGRTFFCRHDYDIPDAAQAAAVMQHLGGVAAGAAEGAELCGRVLRSANDFSYTDPVDGATTSNQGLRFIFADGSRIVFRLSGTGSRGATLRVYLEHHCADPARLGEDAREALRPLAGVALELSRLEHFTGLREPSVVT